MRWYEALATVLAAAAAFGAWAAAWATKRAAEAQILLDLLNDYATPEMAEALRTLGSWREQHGDEFADDWRQATRTLTRWITRADASPRISRTSTNWALSAAARAVFLEIRRFGLAVLINVCGPLERKLNPRVNLGFVRRVRALCPHRRDPMSAIPLQRLE